METKKEKLEYLLEKMENGYEYKVLKNHKANLYYDNDFISLLDKMTNDELDILNILIDIEKNQIEYEKIIAGEEYDRLFVGKYKNYGYNTASLKSSTRTRGFVRRYIFMDLLFTRKELKRINPNTNYLLQKIKDISGNHRVIETAIRKFKLKKLKNSLREFGDPQK